MSQMFNLITFKACKKKLTLLFEQCKIVKLANVVIKEERQMQVLQIIDQWWYQVGTIVKQIITSTNDTKLFQSKGITKLLKK
jgi:hypothetical protein